MNNLDSSSNGIKIEMSIQYDNNLSQHWFDSCFVRLEYDKGFVFTDYGNLPNDFDLTDLDNYNLKSITNKTLLKSVQDHFGDCIKDDSLSHFGKYPYQLNKLELIELVENLYDRGDYLDFLQDNFTKLYTEIETRGYCQGDFNTVIVSHEYFDNKEPTQGEITSLRTEIDRLCWDAPIDQWLELDEEQFYLDDYIKDRYTYDKEETIQIVKDNLEHDKKAYIIEWLEENLPINHGILD